MGVSTREVLRSIASHAERAERRKGCVEHRNMGACLRDIARIARAAAGVPR